MKKKLLKISNLVLMAIMSLSIISLPAYATTNEVNQRKEIAIPQNEIANEETNITITDPIELENYIKTNEVTIPEGSVLTEVIYTTETPETPPVTPQGRAIVLRNVVTRSGNYVISGQETYDQIYNYSYTQDSYERTFEQSLEAGFNANVGINVSDVSAGVGFEAKGTVRNERKSIVYVPARTKVTVKIQTNFLMKDFSVYNTGFWNNQNNYVGSGTAWRPVGLIIEKYESRL